MDFVIPSFGVPSVAVADREARFPVRRVFCVGRNYAAHAREMGGDPERQAPFFFAKPADAVVDDGVTVAYPPLTEDLHHEVELVVAVGTAGRNLTVDESAASIWGYAIGNDLTRRDLQREAKKHGRPWAMSKGFDQSAVIGPVHPVAAVGHLERGAITCAVNDELRQEGDLSELIWSVPEVVSMLSRAVALAPGDLIMTGTPAGVGPLLPGDGCVCRIDGLGEIRTPIGPAL